MFAGLKPALRQARMPARYNQLDEGNCFSNCMVAPWEHRGDLARTAAFAGRIERDAPQRSWFFGQGLPLIARPQQLGPIFRGRLTQDLFENPVEVGQ